MVRHAHAGAKDRGTDEDRLRPLSDRGRREALALADLLAPHEPRRIVSSPLVRCLQTVGPLAARLGVAVEESDALGPQSDREAARLLRSLASEDGTAVVCTHGETIEALQRRLTRPGKLAFAPGGAHEKGSVWLLQASRGRFVSAVYLAPCLPPSGGAARDGARSDGALDGARSDGARRGRPAT